MWKTNKKYCAGCGLAMGNSKHEVNGVPMHKHCVNKARYVKPGHKIHGRFRL